MFILAQAVLALLILSPAAAAPTKTLHANDGSRRPPRLWIVQNTWGLQGVPDGQTEWTLEEKLTRLRAAGGFDAIDQHFKAEAAAEANAVTQAALFRKFGFGVGLHTSISRQEQIASALALARKMRSPYVDAMVGGYGTPDDEARTLLAKLVETFRGSGVALMIQTHRGLVTQDLHRTVAHAAALPDLRFDLDFSHYVVAGELRNLSDKDRASFLPLIQRATMMDGRVGNGEQVQIDIGPAGEAPAAAKFAPLYKAVFVHWLQQAAPGDLFPFRIELGPPPYAIVDPRSGREISDRWEQTLAFRTFIERVWNEAVAETGKGERHGAKPAPRTAEKN